MHIDITKFVANYDICEFTKEFTTQKHSELHLLPIPMQGVRSWGINFITNLLLSNGCNALMTCVNWLDKINKLVTHCMGQNILTACKVARLFFANMVRQYSVPQMLVHNRNPHFTSAFWCALC